MAWRNVEPSKLHRLFYPEVPTIVTANHNEIVGGMAAASAMAVAAEPPTVGISFSVTSATLGLARSSGYFALNWIDAKNSEEVDYLGFKALASDKDKIAAAGFTWRAGRVAPVPVIVDASAVAECRLEREVWVGDHVLVLGRVLAAYAIEDFEEYWKFKGYRPLLYIGSVQGEPKGRYADLRLPP